MADINYDQINVPSNGTKNNVWITEWSTNINNNNTKVNTTIKDKIKYVELKSSLPATGDVDNLYIVYGDTDENNGQYRWNGSAYEKISIQLDYATQVEAETGTNTVKTMTPLRTFQSIAKWITTTTVSALSTTSKTITGAINELFTNKLDTTGDAKDTTVTFTEATTRENILTTDKMSTLFGKVKKWFTDLKTIAFSGHAKDAIITDTNSKYTSENVDGALDEIGLQMEQNAEQINSLDAEVVAHKADYASLFLTNADAKNSIYRGKYLGNTVTAEQYAAISSGTFTDLYIGDYWTIGGVNWRIAAFNYYRNTGDSLVPGNHITLVPDTQLYTHVMNDTNVTTGGYVGSKMYTEGLEQAKTTIRGIFGTHLVKHGQIHSNAIVDGKASGWALVDSEVDLMGEIMVYGSIVWGESTIGGSGHNIGVGKSQLPLFALNPRMINTRQSYWLRDVVSAAYFAYVYYLGNANHGGASGALGVRPAFSIS